MSRALLAHVRVSEAARFDVEHKVLAGLPITQDDAELLVVLASGHDSRVEELEGEVEDVERERRAAQDEADEANDEAEELKAKLALVPDEVQELVEQVQSLTLELREAKVALAELRHAKPYRYVRSARTRAGVRWALWERPTGERAKRVGTAHTEDEYRAFLKGA